MRFGVREDSECVWGTHDNVDEMQLNALSSGIIKHVVKSSASIFCRSHRWDEGYTGTAQRGPTAPVDGPGQHSGGIIEMTVKRYLEARIDPDLLARYRYECIRSKCASYELDLTYLVVRQLSLPLH